MEKRRRTRSSGAHLVSAAAAAVTIAPNNNLTPTGSESPIEGWLETVHNVKKGPPADQSLMSLHDSASVKRKFAAAAVTTATRPTTSSSDDEEEDLFKLSTSPPLMPLPSTKRRQQQTISGAKNQIPSAIKTTTTAEAADVPLSPPRPQSALKQTNESAKAKSKSVTFASTNRDEIRQEQVTRRTMVRSAVNALRREIPDYDSTLNDVERDIVIDQDTYRAARDDSAFEFQDAWKPPWAARVPQDILDKIRAWDIMEYGSEMHLREQPFYKLLLEVAGSLQVSVDRLIVSAPESLSADAVRPSSSILSTPPPISAGITENLGIASINRALATDTGRTPVRDESFAPPSSTGGQLASGLERFRRRRERNASRSGGPEGGGGGGGGGGGPPTAPPGIVEGGSFFGTNTGGIDLTSLGLAAPPLSPTGEAMLEPRTENQIEEELLLATQNAFAGRETAQTGARFSEFREKRRTNPQWYEYAPGEEARNMSAAVRGAGARGRAWISRPIALGIIALNPAYKTARNSAYTQIVCRAQQLSTVKMEFFARSAPSGTVQFVVFSQFAALIAEHYRFNRNKNNTSAKLASDSINLAASTEALVRFFVNRISFNSASHQFFDSGIAHSLDNTPPWARNSVIDVGPPQLPYAGGANVNIRGYNDCDDNPLLLRLHPGEDTLHAGGNLLVSQRRL